MKKILSFLALVLISAMSYAASITATDVDFGTISIKGQDLPVTGSQTVTVTFSGLATDGYSMYAEVVEGLLDDETQPSGFYVSPGTQYLGYGVGSGTMDFTVTYSVKTAGTFKGKVEFSCYDPSYNEVKGYANLTITANDDAIVPKVVPFERINQTSELKNGDVVVFVSEAAGSVGGALDGARLPEITEYVTVNKTTGKADIPQTAQMFQVAKFGSNDGDVWQFTTTDTQKRLHLDVTGSGAFTYADTQAGKILANWGVEITDGVAIISRPDEEQSFTVRYNSNVFKPYKSTQVAGDVALYKKAGEPQDVQSALAIEPTTVAFGDVAFFGTKKVEITYSAKNLTEDIVWAIEGSDAALFDVDDEGDRISGTVTVTYNGTGSHAGSVDAKLSYMTQDIKMDDMMGAYPISINLMELNSISFKQTNYDLLKNEEKDLNAELVFDPANVANKGIEWKFNTSYYNATISDAGVFKATATGEYVVVATSVLGENIQAKCTLKVSLPIPESVELGDTELTMYIGEKKTLAATIQPEGTEKSVVFASDNTDVATVDKNGLITAKALGSAVITVSVKDYPEVKSTCQVTVSKATVESISLPETASVTSGSTLQLEPVVTPAQAAVDHGVNYSSDNEAVATVSESGLVSGVSEGEAVITVSCDDKSAQITIRVAAPALFDKLVSASKIGANDTIILAAKVTINAEQTPIVAGALGTSSNLTVVTDGVTLTDDAAYADKALLLVVGGTKDQYTLTVSGTTKKLTAKDDAKLEYGSKNTTWKFEDYNDAGVIVRNTAYPTKALCHNSQSSLIRQYAPGSNSTPLIVYVRKYIAPQPTGVEAPAVRNEVRKVLRDGQLLIIRNGEIYTVTGEKR